MNTWTVAPASMRTGTAFARLCLALLAASALAACTGDKEVPPADSGASGDSAGQDAGELDSGAGDTVGADVLDSGSADTTGADLADGQDPDSTVPDGSDDAVVPDGIGDSGDAKVVDVDGGSKDGGAPGKDDFQELLVKILGPSGRNWLQNEGQKIQLSGVAFGFADSAAWTSSNGKSGVIAPAAGSPFVAQYWQTGIIDLDPGDNLITIEAKKGALTARDTVHITYNPFFSFDGAPAIAPNVAFVNQQVKLVVGMTVPAATPDASGSSIVDANSIHLIEVDANGKAIAGGVDAKLIDNGQGGNCDDVQKDAVYSSCVSFTPSSAKTMYFRVKASVDVFGKKYDALSPVTTVDIVPYFDKSECKQIVGLQQKVKADYLSAVGTSGPAQAQQQAILALKADGSVAEAGPASGGGYGIWVRYKSGRVGALSLAPAGTRGAGSSGGESEIDNSGAALPTYSVGTRRALALAPAQSEFEVSACAAKPADASACGGSCPGGEMCLPSGGPGSIGACHKASAACSPACGDDQVCAIAIGDEAAEAGAALKSKQCPPFAVDMYNNNTALLRYYREMSTYGFISITGHGDVFFEGMDAAAKEALGWEHLGAQEVIWSGEKVDCDALSNSPGSCTQQGGGCPNGQTCVKTSMQGGVCVDHTQGDIMTGRAVIGDTVYGITPSFLQRHSVEPFAAAIVYLGACRTMYNGSIAVQLYGNGAAAVLGFSDYVTNAFAYQTGHKLMDGLINHGESTLQAMTVAEDPQHPGSRLRLIGNGKANAKDDSLINPSWDLGKLTGWKAVGDGRVISRLGVTIPVAGKYMGIISTGLGFTVQNGSLEQPFCIPAAKDKLCYYWKFYSEEFTEWCGSSYMDRFTSTLQADTGKITMTDVWIDQLCPYDCGGKSACDPGSPQCKCGQQWKTLSNADVIFDQGGVWMTPWQKTCVDITPLAGSGKKATLKFFATDTGDSIYDTVVLVDQVTVE